MAHLDKLSLNFSSLSFTMRVNLVLHNAHTFIERLVVYKEVNNCVLNLVLLHISHILKTINRVAPRITRSERTEGNQNCK